MTTRREIREGRITQGVDEQIPYSVNVAPWGTSPTSVTVVVKDASNSNTDVTATVTTGSSSVSGNVITLPTIYNLTQGNTYRVEVKFTVNGRVLECYAYIDAEL